MVFVQQIIAITSTHTAMEITLTSVLLCLFVLVLAYKKLFPSKKQYKNLPPSPPAIPVIGHLHLLKQPINRTFHSLSQKYGPVFSLRLGSRLAVIVSSPSAVEECFTKNDTILANRPPFLAGKYTNYNLTTLTVANYGDHWRNLRRVSAIEIFSSSRLNAFRDVRRDEVNTLLKRLNRVSANGFAKVEMRALLMDLTFNAIMRMVAGKKFNGEDVTDVKDAKVFREIIQGLLEFCGTPNLGDLYPSIQWLDYDGFQKKLIQLGDKADAFWQKLIDEHRHDNEDRNTMISHLLALQKQDPDYYTDEIIKGLILIILTAGTETTAISLEWAMANLLNNPDVMKKAKMELDAQIGEDHLIDESDVAKLPYIQCVVQENLRLSPVAPLLIPHWSSDYCTIGGYDIPPDTMLFVNAWAIQRDPTLWDDPTSFKPERFETGKGGDKAYKVMPFGLGRRACPGEAMANRMMALALGAMIQCFEFDRVGGKQIDTTEKIMVTMSKAEPLEVMCKARPVVHKFLS